MNIKQIKKSLKEKLPIEISENSVSRYIQAITKSLKYLKTENPSRNQIIKFLNHIGKKYSSTYRRFIFYALKKYFKIFNLEWQVPKDLAGNPEIPKRTIITKEDLNKIIKLAKETDIKDYAIFRIARETGVRRCEIANLLKKHYTPPILTIDTAKKGNHRQRTLTKETINAINEYLKTRTDKSERLFKTSSSQLSIIFRYYADKIGLPKNFGFHSIRRYLVTKYYNAGIEPMVIVKFMGWKGTEMLETYTRLSQKSIEEKINKVDV